MHDDRHQSGEQSGERKPIQPKAIGGEHGRHHAKNDAGKHEKYGLVSASLQIISYRHGVIGIGGIAVSLGPNPRALFLIASLIAAR
jgi:hypothetical protein